MRFGPHNEPIRFMGHPGFEAWHVVLTLLLIGVLAAALVLLIMNIRRHPAYASVPAATPIAVTAARDNALHELRMRYARGEIAREDFLQAHADLGGSAPPEATD